MWAREITYFDVDEEDNKIEKKHVEVNMSWYDIIQEGVGSLVFGFVCYAALAIALPFMVVHAAYQQYRYQNTPLPPDEVRERSYF